MSTKFFQHQKVHEHWQDQGEKSLQKYQGWDPDHENIWWVKWSAREEFQEWATDCQTSFQSQQKEEKVKQSNPNQKVVTKEFQKNKYTENEKKMRQLRETKE